MLRPLLLFLHLAGVIVWVGGMFFAYFCLRPAAVRVLQPPQRLPLWFHRILSRVLMKCPSRFLLRFVIRRM